MAENEDEDEVTHGERFAYLKANIDSKKSAAKILMPFSRLPKKMVYMEASVYYTKKIRGYFEQQLTIKSFDKVEDYFGYYEAIKIRNLIEKM